MYRISNIVYTIIYYIDYEKLGSFHFIALRNHALTFNNCLRILCFQMKV